MGGKHSRDNLDKGVIDILGQMAWSPSEWQKIEYSLKISRLGFTLWQVNLCITGRLAV